MYTESVECNAMPDTYRPVLCQSSVEALGCFPESKVEAFGLPWNKLCTLNIRKTTLTQLDCSDNPLRHLDWHPRYSALVKVCMKNTQYPNQKIASLNSLLKVIKGRVRTYHGIPHLNLFSFHSLIICVAWIGVG